MTEERPKKRWITKNPTKTSDAAAEVKREVASGSENENKGGKPTDRSMRNKLYGSGD